MSTAGLDDGREVFTTFRSGTPVGDTAIATWRAWLRRLVSLVGDTVLAERYRDLEDRLPSPPPAAPAIATPLLHNLDTPIADQLADRLPAGSVDELWLTAPFFDANAHAVGVLLDTLKPSRVRLFVTSSTNVNGTALAARIEASGAAATIAAYQPDTFVHAKLIGVITGQRGMLLSGSANLSQAALTLTPATGGNAEMAVLAPVSPDELRAAFIPPELTAEERSVASLSSLTFTSDPEPPPPAIRLLVATADRDGRVEILVDRPAESGWLLDDLISRYPLQPGTADRASTTGQVAGRLVQIADGAGTALSNRVVVDDPVELAAALAARGTRPAADRPSELSAGDLDSPLGQALLTLHRTLVMDVSERATSAPAGGVANHEVDQPDDDELWDRLEHEQLARDPRSGTYSRAWRRYAAGTDDPLIELLETLRGGTVTAATGLQGRSLLTHLLDNPLPPVDRQDRIVRRWSPSARIRVRARNVLRRWAAAQTDPRLVWVNPLAPAGNFALIAATFASLYLDRARDPDRVELNEADLDDLWQRWLRPFAGTGEGDGWLDQLDGIARSQVTERFPEWLAEVVAALCWLIVRPRGGHRGRVVAFQPVLSAALAHRLIEPTDASAAYLTAIVGRAVTRDGVDGDLLEAVTFIDDDLWCAQTRADLALASLTLHAPPGGGGVQVRLDVAGIADPLLDPRVPRLVATARHYRRCDGVALFATDAGWRLALATGVPIGYRHEDGHMTESSTSLDEEVLDRISGAGGVLSDLFPATTRVA